MNHELPNEEPSRPKLVVTHREKSREVTKDGANVQYDAIRYVLQQEGATGEGAPYVKIEQHNTGGDSSFFAMTPDQYSSRIGGTVPAGPGPGAELHLDVQDQLSEEHATIVAEQLADLMFRISEMET